MVPFRIWEWETPPGEGGARVRAARTGQAQELPEPTCTLGPATSPLHEHSIPRLARERRCLLYLGGPPACVISLALEPLLGGLNPTTATASVQAQAEDDSA